MPYVCPAARTRPTGTVGPPKSPGNEAWWNTLPAWQHEARVRRATDETACQSGRGAARAGDHYKRAGVSRPSPIAYDGKRGGRYKNPLERLTSLLGTSIAFAPRTYPPPVRPDRTRTASLLFLWRPVRWESSFSWMKTTGRTGLTCTSSGTAQTFDHSHPFPSPERVLPHLPRPILRWP